ncbi:hypothetical protein SCMU_19280 [Sinomonas cyclohexanicum]|uniref:Helix-turn-helix domain-containing protein n=1 Tax=Sinomonas cyclohexanicum TaxID=322009 RepID=A0ABN6FH22_SINCY|nr:helix-turn-helix domain-containing protein [Corynebacterium cyclohexanicum]BCT76086.1 hypothetical protein SCMU_19280 [Corynebacterium cyclohexanicum]
MSLNDLRASTANVISVAQAAAALADLEGHRPDERTVRRACEDGQLPAIRLGKRILIPRLAFLAILDGTPERKGNTPKP